MQKEKLEIDLSKENLISKDYVKSKWSYLVKIIENKNPKIAQFIDDVEIVDLMLMAFTRAEDELAGANVDIKTFVLIKEKLGQILT